MTNESGTQKETLLANPIATDAVPSNSRCCYTGILFASVGGVLTLALCGMPVSISAGMGFIALFGVAVLNGLVMVSYINKLSEEGRAAEQ